MTQPREIVLSEKEADEVLECLSDMKLFDVLKNPILMSAINKLNGTDTQNVTAKYIISGDKISLIKAIRHLIQFGLKEAKDYVENPAFNMYGGVLIDPHYMSEESYNLESIRNSLVGISVKVYIKPREV